MIGMDDADHAILRIDDGQCVEIVFIEHLGELVLMHARGAGEEAGLGEDGEAFLSRLPVDHHLSAPAREALKLAREKAAPRSAPSPAAARALRAASPKLAVSALKPLWLHGGDLEELGVKPGPKMGEILNAAARAQWEGLLPSRAKALAWLKKRV